MFFHYNLDPPINNLYVPQTKALKDALNLLSTQQISYINYVLDLSSAGLIICLPTSPTHIFLALKMTVSYWDPERNMVYVYYNEAIEPIFFSALFRALGKAHIYSLARDNASYMFSIVSDVFSYYVSFVMGTWGIYRRQIENIFDVLIDRVIRLENKELVNNVVTRVLGWLLSIHNPNIHTVANILARDPKVLLRIHDEFEKGESKRVWINALASLGLIESTQKVANHEDIYPILIESELDKVTYDIIIAIGALAKTAIIRGSEYIQAKYSGVLEKIERSKILRELLETLLSKPDQVIQQMDLILPGTKRILEQVNPENIIKNIFAIV